MESFLGQRIFPAAVPTSAAPANPPGFHPLFSVLDGSAGSFSEPRETATATAVEEAASQIEIRQENGRVTRIIVTCKCCERIELECDY